MTKKLAIIYHNLSTLLEAGLPILRSLDSVTEGLEGRFKKVFSEVRKSISQGNSVSEAMAKYKKVFGKLDVMLVDAAEKSGNLPRCFKLLSNWYEFRIRMYRIIKKGLILPAIVLTIALTVIPLPSLILGEITISKYFLKIFGPLGMICFSFILLMFIYRLTRKVNSINYFLDSLTLRIPVLGQGIFQLSISRYCRAFNMLYKAGVPITESLTTATELAGNSVVSGFFRGGEISAKEGNIASTGFSRNIPHEYLSLWEIGEETGELEKTVDKISEISRNKAELLLTEVARWLPIIIYFMISIWMVIQVLKGYSRIYSGLL